MSERLRELTTKESKGGKILIFADGEYLFSLEPVYWYSLDLRDGDEVPDETFEALRTESERRRAADSALRVLTSRSHSRAELKMKLRRKYGTDAVEYAIERCEEMGFIDDAAYAREKAEYLRSVKGYAPVRILGELRAAGIDNAIADEALDSLEFSPEDEIPRIIERKYRGADLSDEKTRRRVVSALQRMGYSASDIFAAISAFDDCGDEF